jgi:hypothetical protein
MRPTTTLQVASLLMLCASKFIDLGVLRLVQPVVDQQRVRVGPGVNG